MTGPRDPARPELRSVTATFARSAGTIEEPDPGTKTRTTTAARMARRGLALALERLEGEASSSLVWGGFGTDTRISRDEVLAEAKLAKREAG
ncbi:MAG TPA: hypothetical protein VGP38_10390 [Rubrobacter sp.]|nr:hypothetical protein [Rubrobacter sp.]